jgi:hypothetical protein
MLPYLVFIVIVLILAYYAWQEYQPEEEPKVEPYIMENVDELPKIRDSKGEGEEYLTKIAKAALGEAAFLNHQKYTARRRLNGDHTKQLWGKIDGFRANTNFIASRLRPPRQVHNDPTSPLQNETMDFSDFTDPKEIRII